MTASALGQPELGKWAVFCDDPNCTHFLAGPNLLSITELMLKFGWVTQRVVIVSKDEPERITVKHYCKPHKGRKQ